MTKKNKQRGFTLIELMIVVAIIGVLGSIAMPSYMEYVKKSKRMEAKTELLSIAQLQESYYIQNLSYSKALNTGLGFAAATTETERGLYNISSQGLPTTCNGTNASPCTRYNVTATPVVGKGQDTDEKCTGFLINNTGFKGARSIADSTWHAPKNIKACWG